MQKESILKLYVIVSKFVDWVSEQLEKEIVPYDLYYTYHPNT